MAFRSNLPERGRGRGRKRGGSKTKGPISALEQKISADIGEVQRQLITLKAQGSQDSRVLSQISLLRKNLEQLNVRLQQARNAKKGQQRPYPSLQ